LSFLVTTISSASAAYEGGTRKVKNIFIDKTYIYVLFDPAPIFCMGGDYYTHGHVKIPMSAMNAEYLYTMALTSYTTGEDITGIWHETTNGVPCSTSYVPNLEGLSTRK